MNANDNLPSPRERPAATKRERTCPICGKPQSARYAPFCSRRCADVDLHRWLKGAYVIPGGASPQKPGEEE